MKRSGRKKGTWADHYTHKAKKEHYPARSVYKLQEIQAKNRILKPGQQVLDLGCAPGAWLLYAAQQVGLGGQVIGIDLNPVTVRLPENACSLTADIFALDPETAEAMGTGFDVVLSDMAPATIGHKGTDALRSEALAETALDLALKLLVPGGHFVCKLFQGGDLNRFTSQVKQNFNKQKNFKPKSSRKASKELFVLGLGRK